MSKEKIEVTFTDANGGKFHTQTELSPQDDSQEFARKTGETFRRVLDHRRGLKDPKKS